VDGVRRLCSDLHLTRLSKLSSPVRAAAGGDEPASKLLPQNVSMEDFQMRDIVGKGGKSIGVQIAYHMKLNRYFAVKIINEVAAEREHWEIQPRTSLAALRDVTAAGVPFVVALRGLLRARWKDVPRHGLYGWRRIDS